jgi:hypothetical protein
MVVMVAGSLMFGITFHIIPNKLKLLTLISLIMEKIITAQQTLLWVLLPHKKAHRMLKLEHQTVKFKQLLETAPL